MSHRYQRIPVSPSGNRDIEAERQIETEEGRLIFFLLGNQIPCIYISVIELVLLNFL
jgi:hypothetical protein